MGFLSEESIAFFNEFYGNKMSEKPMVQQTAVEWFAEQSEKILIDLAKNNNTFQLELCLHGLNELEVQAKEMFQQQIESAWKRGDGEHDKVADELSKKYYNETYDK
jgi:hypothetical protein